jgi:hypothetical protein
MTCAAPDPIGYYLPMRPAARLLALILGNQTRAAGLSR